MATLFKRATNERAYVRTGHGGEIIALNTGIFVLPVLHQVQPVNLKTIRLQIELADELSVVTKDYMKVNIAIDFYVRIIAEPESISQAARILGELTLFPEQLTDFLDSQLIHAIRMITAKMSMVEIHQQQSVFVEKIQSAVNDHLIKNSLQLESVTLKQLDQTAREFLIEDNAFDAEGLSGITEIIESEKQTRHQIERQYKIENKQKEIEMEKLLIEMENKKNRMRIEQEREIKIFEAANALTITQDGIKKSTEEKQAEILAEQELEISRHQAEIILGVKLREKLKQQIETDLLKAEAAKAKIGIKLASKLEKADSQIKIKLLIEKRKDERETSKITELAIARKKAACEEANAVRVRAEADKLRILENSKLEAEKLIEANLKNKYQCEAEGLKIMIDAFNSLSKSELPRDVYPELIELFADLCMGNNQVISRFGLIQIDTENEYGSFDSITSKRKTNDSLPSKSKTSKLKAILDEARNSLTKEALNTINGIDLESRDQCFQDKEKV